MEKLLEVWHDFDIHVLAEDGVALWSYQPVIDGKNGLEYLTLFKTDMEATVELIREIYFFDETYVDIWLSADDLKEISVGLYMKIVELVQRKKTTRK